MNTNLFMNQCHFDIKGEDIHKYWLLDSIKKSYFRITINKHVKYKNQEIKAKKLDETHQNYSF